MEKIANLIFEARMLKEIPRSGFAYLGAGRESVAEHSFTTTFIAYVLAQLSPQTDAHRTICMCLLHDLPEARIGDLNTVNKHYVQADEEKALSDTIGGLPFGTAIADLISEFNAGQSVESKLARDADQLALIIELKAIEETGHKTSSDWLPNVVARLLTETGRQLAQAILETKRDTWWHKVCS